MQIYVGSYDGSITTIQATPLEIRVKNHLQISTNSIKSVGLINDKGTMLAAGGYDQELRVVDLSTNQQKIQAKQNTGQITHIKRVNDQYCLVGVEDGTMRLWNTSTWTIAKQIRIHKKSISSIVLSQDKKIMLSSGGKKLIIWNALTLQMSFQYKLETDIDQIGLTSDLANIFIISNSRLIEIQTQSNTHRQLINLGLGHKIQYLEIFKNFIIVATDSGQIIAWQIGNYEHLIKFKAHDSRIKAIKVLDYEGLNYLLIASAAGDVSIWDFLEFLDSVDGISQDYNLEGLKPLCSVNIKSRILAMEAQTIKIPVKKEKVITEKMEQKKKQKKLAKQIKTKKIQKTVNDKWNKKNKYLNKKNKGK